MIVNININEIQKKTTFPNWIKVRAPLSEEFYMVQDLIKKNKLETVCESAACPNIAECWKRKHATFMIMGNICTRKCRFCNVKNGKPNILDIDEPLKVAESVKTLGLKHVVVTSVDRDDLPDGGAEHFANTVMAIKAINKETSIEVLTPDFLNKGDVFKKIVFAKPDVFNHNIETVRRLFKKIKLGANFDHSLNLLRNVKAINSDIFTKSGIIVGMGESNEEVIQTMEELRFNNVDFLTIGQYLRPRESDKRYINIDRFVTLEEFDRFKEIAYKMGFKMVSASPLTRSSYHAGELFEQLKTTIVS